MCYVKHRLYQEVIHFNSFHNKLKTTYLKGKVNRRVDFLLNVLFQIEEDNFFNYQRKQQLPPANTEGTRHQQGMRIPIEGVEVSYVYCMVDSCNYSYIHCNRSLIAVHGGFLAFQVGILPDTW